MLRLTLMTLAFALASPPAHAQRVLHGKVEAPGDQGPSEPDGVGFEQKLGAAVPLDLPLYDHDAKPVTLREIMANGKPTILCLAYYGCPKLCNVIGGNLVDALKDEMKRDPEFVAGRAFNLVMVTIDPREGALTLARPKRENYLRDYDGRDPSQPGFWLLTASPGQGNDVPEADRRIHQLADAVGFDYTLRARGKNYTFDPESGIWRGSKTGSPLAELPRTYDYNHSAGVVLLTPDGRVSSYLMGMNFLGSQLKQGVELAARGEVGEPTAAGAVWYCQVYDSVKSHYAVVLRYLGWLAAPVALFVAYLVYNTYRKAKAETPLTLPPA